MNYPARVFRDLLSSWHYNSSSPRIDILAAELTTEVVNARTSLCLGLMEKEALPKLFGLSYVLNDYGLILRQRYRKQNDGIFIFVDQKQNIHQEFKGNIVKEKRLEPIYQLARAA